MATPRSSSADNAMIEVLGHLNEISNYLRYKGQHDAANSIGKLSIDIVNAYSQATDELVLPNSGTAGLSPMNINNPASQSLFSSEALPTGDSVPDSSPIHPPRKDGAECGPEPTTITQPRDTAKMLLLDFEDHNASNQPENNSALRATWEHLANGHAFTIANGNLQNGCSYQLPLLSFPNLQAVNASALYGNGALTKSDQTPFAAGSIQVQKVAPPEEEKAGIIVIRGNFQGRTVASFISFIAEHIHEGPLFEIKVESPHKSTVIFQYFEHARQFISRNQESLRATGVSCLGGGYQIFLGGRRDWDEDIKRMNHPGRERRRLTFAKSRLFGEQLSPQQWERDVMSIAGGPNVNILWIFNAGNATAVFRSTLIARKVLSVFQNWKITRPPYYGLEISFSADPCEKELVLSTQMKWRPRNGSGSRNGRR